MTDDADYRHRARIAAVRARKLTALSSALYRDPSLLFVVTTEDDLSRMKGRTVAGATVASDGLATLEFEP
jgi:hypothetical protein